MKFEAAVRQATTHLLNSDKARTYKTAPDVWGEQQEYTLELTREPDDPNVLIVETWGFDYTPIFIPQTRTELIKRKMQLQLRMADGLTADEKIEFRYLMDILRRESND